MRILLVHNYFKDPGGEETYVDMINNLLKKNGNYVHLYTKHNQIIEKMNFLQKISLVMGMFWNSKANTEIGKIIKTFKPNVVHFNNIYPLISPSVYWICKKNNVRIIQSILDLRFLFPNMYPQGLLKSSLYSLVIAWHKIIGTFDLVDKYIFTAEYVRRLYLSNSSIIKIDKSIIVPYDIRPYKGKLLRRENTFLFAGRLSEEKGPQDLLEVFKDIPQAKLIIAGDGPLKSKLTRLKNYPNIKFLGRITKKVVLKLMASVKIVIVPSRVQETLPMAVFEAFSCKTPVLVPKNGVFNSLVKEGQTGYFYKYKSVDDLRKKIIRLLDTKISEGMRRDTLNKLKAYSNNVYPALLRAYKGTD
jgi:glycosyltransferase involved in cell wall biosynthesis